jgi:hypothetical protein
MGKMDRVKMMGSAEKSRGKKQGGESRNSGIRRIGIALLILLLSGCGYSFSGISKSAYPNIRSIFIDTFTNKTSEANLDVTLRTAFSNEMVQNGHFKLAANRDEADAIFRGTIIGLQVAPLAYKAASLSAEDRITVTMELLFEEKASGRILWTNSAFIGTADYRVVSVGVTEANRRAALAKLASDAAENAYRLMMSDF